MNFIGFLVLVAALAFCGIGDKLMSGESSPASNKPPASTQKGNDADVDKAEMTSAQQAIADTATEVKWDQQNISWKMPAGFAKMQVMKESLTYGSPGSGFMSCSISVMPSDFPSESSIKATYDSSMEMLKQGKYEMARWLEIDGVKGVEWIESQPELPDGIRRHQWIGFRNYQGQNQQLNMNISTDGNKFGKQKDAFAAILYSMKIAKG
jgi:hypothetical protein